MNILKYSTVVRRRQSEATYTINWLDFFCKTKKCCLQDLSDQIEISHTKYTKYTKYKEIWMSLILFKLNMSKQSICSNSWYMDNKWKLVVNITCRSQGFPHVNSYWGNTFSKIFLTHSICCQSLTLTIVIAYCHHVFCPCWKVVLHRIHCRLDGYNKFMNIIIYQQSVVPVLMSRQQGKLYFSKKYWTKTYTISKD